MRGWSVELSRRDVMDLNLLFTLSTCTYQPTPKTFGQSFDMPHDEQGTYFLYGRGYSPEELGLGHLVLETYENPRNKQFQPFTLLR